LDLEHGLCNHIPIISEKEILDYQAINKSIGPVSETPYLNCLGINKTLVTPYK